MQPWISEDCCCELAAYLRRIVACVALWMYVRTPLLIHNKVWPAPAETNAIRFRIFEIQSGALEMTR
jgi:hypothetical protein